VSERYSKSECEILKKRPNGHEDMSRSTLVLEEASGEVAILGAFIGIKNEGTAGATVIWRGLQRLSDLEEEWRLLEKLVGKS
jgi:hypothetical protein